MGNVLGSVTEVLKFHYCFRKPEYKITLFGPGRSGKTTILYRLKTNEIVDSMLTCSGFNVETMETKHCGLTIWDVAGSCDSPCTWKYYFPDSKALIFVIDSEDRNYINLTKENLEKAIASDQFQMLKDPILLIWANKHDSPTAMSVDEIVAKLELNLLFWIHSKSVTWHIQPVTAKTGAGLKEGINWITDQIRGKKRSKTPTTLEIPV